MEYGKIIILHGGKGAGKTHWALLWVSLAPQQRRYTTKLKKALEYASWGMDVVLDSKKLSKHTFQNRTADQLRRVSLEEREQGNIIKVDSMGRGLVSDPWEPTP